jgi:peroxiredoxin
METFLQGNLSDTPPNTVLERVARNGLEGILHFRFWNSDLNTKMVIAGEKVGGIIGPFVPSWSASLVPHVVDGDHYERVRSQTMSASQALSALMQQGLLDLVTLERALARRISMGLLPLIGRQDGRFLFVQRPVGQDFVQPGVGIGTTLEDLQMRSGRLPEAFDPNRTFDVLPNDAGLQGLNVQQLEVVSALASGLPVVEVSKRTQLPLDELMLIVNGLRSRGLLAATRIETVIGRPTAPEMQRIRKRLIPGDVAPDFALPSLSGQAFKLSDLRGKRVLMRFNRQAGCPVCNPRNRDFIRLYPIFERASIEVVSVFGSSEDALPNGVGKQNPPYPCLADPKDRVYAQYGVERSLLGIMTMKNMAAIKEGMAVRDAFDMTANGMDGEVTRMPAEFLISPDGVIERTHYHAFAADFLPMDTLMSDWLGLRTADFT